MVETDDPGRSLHPEILKQLGELSLQRQQTGGPSQVIASVVSPNVDGITIILPGGEEQVRYIEEARVRIDPD